MSVLIRNARVLTMDDANTIRDRADVLVEGGAISAVGAKLDVPGGPKGAEVIEADGRVLMPAFVDAHTHACSAGERLDEWDRKQAGATYLEILESGGGIMSTVRSVRDATRAQLTESLLERVLHRGADRADRARERPGRAKLCRDDHQRNTPGSPRGVPEYRDRCLLRAGRVVARGMYCAVREGDRARAPDPCAYRPVQLAGDDRVGDRARRSERRSSRSDPPGSHRKARIVGNLWGDAPVLGVSCRWALREWAGAARCGGRGGWRKTCDLTNLKLINILFCSNYPFKIWPFRLDNIIRQTHCLGYD